ncbi:hypothetical protein [Metallosphaera sp.]|uniref:hypothetical protein n=1 Tax=Metallosphaera sp. TaxID=2020860 RepID=UPI0031791C33
MVKGIVKWYGTEIRVNTERDKCIWESYSEDGYDIYVHIPKHGEAFFYGMVDGEIVGMWKWDVENFLYGVINREIFERRRFPEKNIERAEKFFPEIREYSEKKRREYESVYGGRL